MALKLDFRAEGYPIGDERVNVVSGALKLNHDCFTLLELWSDPGRLGTKLIMNVDYTVTGYDNKHGCSNYITFIATAVPYVFATYTTFGDYVEVSDINTKEDLSSKGQPRGYAALDENGLLPSEYLGVIDGGVE